MKSKLISLYNTFDLQIMLDYFCIFSKGGAILWTWQLTALRGSPVEALIRTCLLEERSGEKSFSYKPPVGSAYTMKWTLDNVSVNLIVPSLLPFNIPT